MANCNICSRKETKRRIIGDVNICSECLHKLKENNYVLRDADKEDDDVLLDRSIITDFNDITRQNELVDDENDILEFLSYNLVNHIKYLQNDIDQKNILIHELIEGLRNINNIKTPTNIMKEHNTKAETLAPFKKSRPSNSHRYTVCLDDEEIQISNRFKTLQLPEEVSDDIETNKYIYNDDENIITNNQATRKTGPYGIKATASPKRRPHVVVKNNPEKENYFLKTVPGRASYRNITKEGKKHV